MIVPSLADEMTYAGANPPAFWNPMIGTSPRVALASIGPIAQPVAPDPASLKYKPPFVVST